MIRYVVRNRNPFRVEFNTTVYNCAVGLHERVMQSVSLNQGDYQVVREILCGSHREHNESIAVQ